MVSRQSKVILSCLLSLIWVLLATSCDIAAVPQDYYAKLTSPYPIENKYMHAGPYETGYTELPSKRSDIVKYEIWYPSSLTLQSGIRYPLVVMANGTGVQAHRYSDVMKHLASWGFIIVGNEDKNSWSGGSTIRSLLYMLQLNGQSSSIFYHKINAAKVGVAGHSQGGVGAINAATRYKSSSDFQAIYTASCTSRVLADSLKWHYDVDRVRIPYLAVAGDGALDSRLIAPLASLRENLGLLSDRTPAAIARRKGVDHGSMLYEGDGYMTAWFMYWLQGDTAAGKAFIGSQAELLTNNRWQDVSLRHLNQIK